MSDITQEEATARWGAIVFQTKLFVIRAKEHHNGQISVVSHPKVSAREVYPRGYILGSNMLRTDAL